MVMEVVAMEELVLVDMEEAVEDMEVGEGVMVVGKVIV